MARLKIPMKEPLKKEKKEYKFKLAESLIKKNETTEDLILRIKKKLFSGEKKRVSESI